MYLRGYVKKYGKYSFKEKPFNELDALVLSTAVYSNFEVVAPSFYDHSSRATLFNEIGHFDLSIVVAGKNTMAGNKKMIPMLCASKRYGNIGIKSVFKVLNEDLANQFYACTFVIPEVGNFIAFRGTDSSIVGWKEDLNLSIHKVVLSQLDALDYLNAVADLVEGPIYVGGHSKGGNLSIFSSIYCKKAVKDRIVKIYSYDGNGLSGKEIFNSAKYLAIQDRIMLIRPTNSIVGQIMFNPESKLFVKSCLPGVFGHYPYSWKISKKTGEFIYQKDFTKRSKNTKVVFDYWLNHLETEDKETLINLITGILGGIKNTVFDFLLSFKKARLVKTTVKKMTTDEKARVKKAFQKLKEAKKFAKNNAKRG